MTLNPRMYPTDHGSGMHITMQMGYDTNYCDRHQKYHDQDDLAGKEERQQTLTQGQATVEVGEKPPVSTQPQSNAHLRLTWDKDDAYHPQKLVEDSFVIDKGPQFDAAHSKGEVEELDDVEKEMASRFKGVGPELYDAPEPMDDAHTVETENALENLPMMAIRRAVWWKIPEIPTWRE